MKHTNWLGAGLCAALVACAAAPPRDTRPQASTASVESARPAAPDSAGDATPLTAMAAMPPASPPAAIAPAPTPAAVATKAVERTPAASPTVPVEAAADTSAVAALEPAMPAKPAPAKPAPIKPAPIKPAPAPGKPSIPVVRTPIATPAPAVGLLTGRLELVGSAGQAVASGEAADGVVYFLPKSGTTTPRPRSVSVDTHSKGFLPGSLVVPAGSTVAFPNRDEILHNVYSATPGTTFDLGTYGPGETRSTRFTKPGLVLVACNVHLGMRANVLVLETPYYTRPGRDGRFELKNLPPGPGTLVFWHPRTIAQSRAITMPATPVTARLGAVRPRIGALR